MRQTKIPAAFIRGGTSNAIVFHERDLPDDRAAWDAIFLAAMGSPDPNGRQLNGMGGGISSLSKVCVVGPPSRDDADIDYTFAQILVRDARVDYSANCGNMSSAMGPFAVDEALVEVTGEAALVRIHNTNTGKIIQARFALDDGEGRARCSGWRGMIMTIEAIADQGDEGLAGNDGARIGADTLDVHRVVLERAVHTRCGASEHLVQRKRSAVRG